MKDASSVALVSDSTWPQQFLLPGLRLCSRVDWAGLPGSSVPSLGVRLVLSRLSWQSWGSKLHKPTSSSPSDPSKLTWSASTAKRWDKTLSLDTGLHFSMRQTISVLINSEMVRWNFSLTRNTLRTYIYWDTTYYFCAVQINKRNFFNHHSKCSNMCFLSFQMAFSGVSYRLLLMKTRDNAPRLNKNMWGTETKQGRETQAKIQKCFANFNSPKGGKHKMLLLFIVVLPVVCLFALFLGK